MKWTDTRPAPAAAPPPKQQYVSMPPQMPSPQGALPVAQYRPSTPPPDAYAGTGPVTPIAPVAPNRSGPARPSTNQVAPVTPIAVGTNGRPRTGSAAPLVQPSSSLDQSISPPKRGKGLILVVLIVDLGLAGAGVYLLLQGLGKL